MKTVYERDLDLNLLRVFVVVADTGSVTEAAKRLYVTQPAVSAALRRLSASVDAPLFVRAGRRIALTARGRALAERARPHLEGLVAATHASARFDPRTTERTVRIGLSDASESWLLVPLERLLAKEAPGIVLIALAVQFRTVGGLLTSGAIDLAVTVADELPSGVIRKPLARGGMVCLFDPRHVAFGDAAPSRAQYFAADHVIVSYNGDLRGVIEDATGHKRRARVSVPTFHAVGALVEGSPLVATLPMIVAGEILRSRPRLQVAPVPILHGEGTLELLVRADVADDPAIALVSAHLERLTQIADERTRLGIGRTKAIGKTKSPASSRKRGPSRSGA